MLIFLDPGHGGSDSGETANGVLEKEVNLDVAQRLSPLLAAGGLTVRLSRDSDVFIPVMDRPAAANAAGAGLFVSIHHNGGGGTGYEIYHSVAGGAGEDLARKIAARFKALGRPAHDGGVKTRAGDGGADYYGVIRGSNMPAVLCEYAYLDSADVSCVTGGDARQAEAQAIAQGIFDHLGIPPAAPAAAAPESPAAASVPAGMPQVRKGSSGDAVRTLQNALSALGFTGPNGGKLAADGDFGPSTDFAVRQFQASRGLAADGVAGPLTWAALLGSPAGGIETVRSGAWNVRSAPTTAASVIGTVHGGECYRTCPADGGWRYLEVKGGYVGPAAF